MSSSFGNNIRYTLFGESHSKGIGITIEGLPAGFAIDFSKIDFLLEQRQGKASFNTPRQEAIVYEIISGCMDGVITGSPLTVFFKNDNTQSKDYKHLMDHPRPGHADYVAKHKYNNANDYRGGGHFSGRLTTPIVFLGGLIEQILTETFPDFKVVSHINQFQDISDFDYYQLRKAVVNKVASVFEIEAKMSEVALLDKEDQLLFAKSINKMIHSYLNNSIKDTDFINLNPAISPVMLSAAEKLKETGDTAGGEIETIIMNPPIFIGEPFFNSLESILASLLYSVPSVKQVGFGVNDKFAKMAGSELKDEIVYADKMGLTSLYNYNGGINGGISNGEDIVINSIIKPISSLSQPQYSYSSEEESIKELNIGGRHDATIINRVIPVINAMACVGIYDLYLERKKHE